jgi:hypothetical protein
VVFGGTVVTEVVGPGTEEVVPDRWPVVEVELGPAFREVPHAQSTMAAAARADM